MNKLNDLTNKQFGKWAVIKYSHVTRNKNGSTVHWWNCKCSCGSERVIRGDSLSRGHTKSCGCINKQIGKNHPTWKGYEDISSTFWKQYKWSAKKRNILFKITIQEAWELFLKQNKKCALTDIDLVFPSNALDTAANASIDRIDSTKGYTIDNIQWVDKRINFMKITLPNNEFIELCKLVAKKHTNN